MDSGGVEEGPGGMNRCLVFRAAFAGDILMSTASLKGIKQKNPGIELSYGLWKQYAEIIALNPHIDKVVAPGHYMVSDYAPNVVDFRHENLTDDYPETYWGRLHAMQCAEKGLLDLEEMESFKPEFFIGPDDVALKKTERLCVINCWSQNGLGWRLWDVEKWSELVSELRGLGFKVVHVGGRGDPKIDCDTDLRGKTRLVQVAGVLAIADLVVAIDSFVAHAAHAEKFVRDVEAGTIEKIGDSTPTVLLAGPIAPSCVAPEDAKCVPVSVYPDCDGPCGVSHPGTSAGRICKFKNSCMKELSIEDVLKGVEVCLS